MTIELGPGAGKQADWFSAVQRALRSPILALVSQTHDSDAVLPSLDLDALGQRGSDPATPGKGEWVWVRGYWLAPAQTPPLKRGPGAPPVAGCTWNSGRWVWQQRDGSWRWIDGSWNAPPPKVENPGAPPVPESPWVAGRWSRTKLSFTWIAGHWDKPRPRVETPTTPPFAGANWQAGTWLQLKGKWIWSPGYYAESIKPPPAPKREVAGTSPTPGAVWLAGFWRWSPEKSSYRWIPGHWEKPPGAGYEWIPDPPDPNVGRSVGGHWKIIVDVPVNIEVRP